MGDEMKIHETRRPPHIRHYSATDPVTGATTAAVPIGDEDRAEATERGLVVQRADGREEVHPFLPVESPMPDEIQPALTPEEWTEWLAVDLESAAVHLLARPGGERKLAALALYGQKFGFTREDVAALLKLAYGDVLDGFANERGRAIAIADRIAALLPPEAPDGR